ncbi:hypothetical protein [Corynebacterium sp. 239_CJEI]|uniref:hypothetical protein n=1 Tax=Corynebacterium sp. 239_CJEI TaxID=2715674 RepID=UPI0006665001|nr:hypothetical protein [Corynebacterium sp. 239_CJEI]
MTDDTAADAVEQADGDAADASPTDKQERHGSVANPDAADGHAADGSDDGKHHDPRLAAARKDAAKYRERLRETESGLAHATARVTGLEHAVIEMANPIAHNVSTAALVKLGLNIGDYISDSGEVDLAGIKQACIDIAADAGINTAPQSGLPIVESVGRVNGTAGAAGNWIGRALDQR